MNRVLVVFSDELLAQVDAARGLASRSAWIRSWCEHGIRVENEWPAVEAVAPLVPGVATGGICPPCPPWEAEPKPKARRKKSVKDSPAASVGSSKAAQTVSETEIVKVVSPESPSFLPQRCNRGACTGTIKPNGRCIRCNQEPLKESK